MTADVPPYPYPRLQTQFFPSLKIPEAFFLGRAAQGRPHPAPNVLCVCGRGWGWEVVTRLAPYLPERCCMCVGGSPRALALPQTQLRRSKRTGVPGGPRAPDFQEAPAAEPAHLPREAKSL